MKWRNLLTDTPTQDCAILVNQAGSFSVGSFRKDTGYGWHVFSGGYMLFKENFLLGSKYVIIDEIEN